MYISSIFEQASNLWAMNPLKSASRAVLTFYDFSCFSAVISPYGTKITIEERKSIRARTCIRAHQCARHGALPGSISNEGISDFCHFANFHDKCLISNKINSRYVARISDDTRKDRNRVL